MQKQRKIRIKGTGKASAVPDYVVLTLQLEAINPDYGCAMRIGAEQVETLREAVKLAGVEAEELKTLRFAVDTDYRTELGNEDSRTTYRRIFEGYRCRHTLQLSFDRDAEHLATVMSAISNCSSKPEISISFTVKNSQALRDKVLQMALEDARHKAEILCKASNVELGEIIYIEWSYSPSHVTLDACWCDNGTGEINGWDFYPNDVDVTETLDFIWEIH